MCWLYWRQPLATACMWDATWCSSCSEVCLSGQQTLILCHLFHCHAYHLLDVIDRFSCLNELFFVFFFLLLIKKNIYINCKHKLWRFSSVLRLESSSKESRNKDTTVFKQLVSYCAARRVTPKQGENKSSVGWGVLCTESPPWTATAAPPELHPTWGRDGHSLQYMELWESA